MEILIPDILTLIILLLIPVDWYYALYECNMPQQPPTFIKELYLEHNKKLKEEELKFKKNCKKYIIITWLVIQIPIVLICYFCK